MVQSVPKDQWVLQALMVPMDLRVVPVHLALLVHVDHKEIAGVLEQLALLVEMVMMVILVRLDLMEIMDCR